MEKRNVLALRCTYNDGKTRLFHSADFIVGNKLSEQLALALAAHAALDWLQDTNKVSICYVDCKYNFEIEDNKVYKEYEVDAEMCQTLYDAFDIRCILPTIRETLEVLPEYCYNNKLRKKLNKIRKNGKCTDWKTQVKDVEWDNNSWWYLHGDVEKDVHYDKAVIINATKCGITKDTVKWYEIRGRNCESYANTPYKQMHFDGIARCKVLGVSADCLGFFYTSDEAEVNYDKGTFNKWEQRGLVVKRSDRLGVMEAYNAYLMRSSFL